MIKSQTAAGAVSADPASGGGAGSVVGAAPAYLTPTERAGRGRAARVTVAPGDQSELVLPADRPDPVALLEQQARSRVPELVPVRYGRMLESPFTFYRGAAAIMAADLSLLPTSGLGVQVCGDAHLSNFGVFGSPERKLLFDINDFDETMPGPWEWDVKRLTASLVIAARGNGFDEKTARKAARAAAWSYRDAMAGFAKMRVLDVWYAHADVAEIQRNLAGELSKARRKALEKNVTKARASGSLKALDKLTSSVDGVRRIKADPPLLVPIADLLPQVEREELVAAIRAVLADYRATLEPSRRALLDQFEFVDMARKVVGVGSVGTRCWILLLRGRDDEDPLFLQVKEAGPSVLEPYIARRVPRVPAPANAGERVVAGQRLMQAASDIFLGWAHAEGIDGVGRDFYIRQLRDMKASAAVDKMEPTTMVAYARLCGWTLARAHARSGDAIAISAYLGEYDNEFPHAVAEFAERYADQNERDHAALVEAVATGRIEAETDL